MHLQYSTFTLPTYRGMGIGARKLMPSTQLIASRDNFIRIRNSNRNCYSMKAGYMWAGRAKASRMRAGVHRNYKFITSKGVSSRVLHGLRHVQGWSCNVDYYRGSRVRSQRKYQPPERHTTKLIPRRTPVQSVFYIQAGVSPTLTPSLTAAVKVRCSKSSESSLFSIDEKL